MEHKCTIIATYGATKFFEVKKEFSYYNGNR